MDGFCRACLVKFDELTNMHHYSERNRRLFVYATGLQVKRNDYIQFQICNSCHSSMKNACAFKYNCRNSEKKLRSYFDMKEDGNVVDFCTFLKNNDESLKFRLPLNIGYSSPVNQKRDDDNESNCTSIQNFMTDIFQAEEIPDNEARIIREVIEEEADILEDSLDSHWLQDDLSMDTDYRLNFSFSLFSTPRSTNDDHCYTPIKQIEDITQDKSKNDHIVQKNLYKDEMEDITLQHIIEMSFENHTDASELNKNNNVCSIDVNIENALNNEESGEVALDTLLATPPVRHDLPGPPTPLIANILFGEKIDSETKSELGDDMDVIDEFLNYNVKEEKEEYLKETDKIECPETPISPVENKYCVTNFYCKMCNRQFKNLKSLKIHCTKHHKIKIKRAPRVKPQKKICDYCGKVFTSNRTLIQHIKNHMDPTVHVCKYCTLKFDAKHKLKLHLSTHLGHKRTADLITKYMCPICGKCSTSSSNYHTHMRRHQNEYTHVCGECGKGFCRIWDLGIHMRRHTGERPYDCKYCSRKFARTDTLNRHMKRHTDENPYSCNFCGKGFPKSYELNAHQKNNKACLKIQVNIAEQKEKDQLVEHLLADVENGIQENCFESIDTQNDYPSG